jgi:hypothetical protein
VEVGIPKSVDVIDLVASRGINVRRCFVLAVGAVLVVGGICVAGDHCSDGGQDSAEGADRGSPPTLRLVRVIEVTDGTERYMMPVWSPDGEKLAFTGPGFRGTYVRNADGSGPLLEVFSPENTAFNAQWTKDSKALVIQRPQSKHYRLTDVETGEVKTGVAHELIVGGVERNIHGHVVHHPDGRPCPPDVELDIDHRDRIMWVVEAEGDSLKRTEFPYQVLLPKLSPRRDLVVFHQADGNTYVSRLDGSALVNLGCGGRWEWSQDGKRLVYLGAIRQDHYNVIASDIFVVNADGSGAAHQHT